MTSFDTVTEKKWYVLNDIKNHDFFEKPSYHITRRKDGASQRIVPGDIIWLFSILNFKYKKLPISLDAKIVTEKIVRKDGKTYFLAGEESNWFPMADARKLLKELKTKSSGSEESRCLWTDTSKPIGLFLQTIRELYNPDRLVSYAEKIRNSPFDFISYRQKDGTLKAFQLAQQLLEDKKILFWDRYGLPRRLTERKEMVPDKLLDEHLIEKIIAAENVWGIKSPGYYELGCYAQKEKEIAINARKFREIEM